MIKFTVENISRCDMGNLFEIWIIPENVGHIISIFVSIPYGCVCVCVEKRKAIICYYLNSDLFLTQKPVKNEGTKGKSGGEIYSFI